MALKRLNFREMNEWVELLDAEELGIESVWAKVDYHKEHFIYKDNITFTVYSRIDIMPGFFVSWGGYNYPVVNTSQINKDRTVLECSLAPDLYPAT